MSRVAPFIFLALAGCALLGDGDTSALPFAEVPVTPSTAATEPFDCSPNNGGGENSADYWLLSGIDFVQQQLSAADAPQRGVAKNLILLLGDGMSLSTLAAARVVIGGEQLSLSFEQFPTTGLAKTYALDRLVPDSACTATAYLCGVKARYGTLGVDGHVERGNCASMLDTKRHVDSIAKWALDAGKAVGVVTTTSVTDASPAAVYAHSSERDWQNDASVASDCGDGSGVQDIAHQLIHGAVGKRLKVVLGGGKVHFFDKQHYEAGRRADGRNLTDEFLAEEGNVYVESNKQLNEIRVKDANRILGLFDDEHLPYNYQKGGTTSCAGAPPTLTEMTEKALEVLESNNPNGFFLFIEGGNIDKAHHATKARLAVDETIEFARAAAVARALTRPDDTLIVVSADHSHTMTLAGYDRRGKDIFGVARSNAKDRMPYLKLSYANGPSFERFRNERRSKRLNPLLVQTHSPDDVFPATVPLAAETHGGDDVPVYASGPWSHLFSGVYEQSTIPHLMAFAAGLTPMAVAVAVAAEGSTEDGKCVGFRCE